MSPGRELLDAATLEELGRSYAQALATVTPQATDQVAQLRRAYLARRRELGVLPEERHPAGDESIDHPIEVPAPKLAKPRGRIHGCISTVVLIWGALIVLGALLRLLGLR